MVPTTITRRCLNCTSLFVNSTPSTTRKSCVPSYPSRWTKLHAKWVWLWSWLESDAKCWSTRLVQRVKLQMLIWMSTTVSAFVNGLIVPLLAFRVARHFGRKFCREQQNGDKHRRSSNIVGTNSAASQNQQWPVWRTRFGVETWTVSWATGGNYHRI